MKNKKVAFWIFLAPVLSALVLVIIIPFLFGIYYSFTNWDGIGLEFGLPIVGAKNYINAFNDRIFQHSFLFTIKYTVFALIIINVVGFSLALLVTRPSRLSNTFRTIFFIPNLIGGLILGFIWQFIFVQVFTSIGAEINQRWLMGWLSNERTGLYGLLILTVWQTAGYYMVIYIAAIQNIPTQLLEAADIDGANYMQKLKHIVFPLVRPAFTVCLFLILSSSFKLFDQNLALTNGGPGNSTQMLAINIYQTAYGMHMMTTGLAKGVIFFFVVALIGGMQVYFSKKKEVEL